MAFSWSSDIKEQVLLYINVQLKCTAQISNKVFYWCLLESVNLACKVDWMTQLVVKVCGRCDWVFQQQQKRLAVPQKWSVGVFSLDRWTTHKPTLKQVAIPVFDQKERKKVCIIVYWDCWPGLRGSRCRGCTIGWIFLYNCLLIIKQFIHRIVLWNIELKICHRMW